jgi:hypothetical protein
MARLRHPSRLSLFALLFRNGLGERQARRAGMPPCKEVEHSIIPQPPLATGPDLTLFAGAGSETVMAKRQLPRRGGQCHGTEIFTCARYYYYCTVLHTTIPHANAPGPRRGKKVSQKLGKRRRFVSALAWPAKRDASHEEGCTITHTHTHTHARIRTRYTEHILWDGMKLAV